MTTEQTPEADAFLARLAALPAGADADALDGVLAPAISDETALRRLWASDRTHARLANPYVGLVDVFAAPAAVRTTYAREQGDDTGAQHVMPLKGELRRASGEPCMSVDMAEFMSNFKLFTEGSLGQLDWSNVVCAGGSVLACLQPVPEAAKASKRALRKHFHTRAFPTSDVDLFLWGLSPAQAETKLQAIYEAVWDAVPWDVTCVRTKHAISIYSQYPYRAVQIVLRLYSSPAELLAGFDVDAPCIAFDGTRVWASPRSLVAQMRQANTVDVSHRSPSYEVRLAKYAARGFEVRVSGLRRADVDPTIFERAITRIGGLARLLVLEKLAAPDTRVAYLDHRRALRGRPVAERPWTRRTRVYRDDLKSAAAAALAQSDYDGGGLHVPYGPGWDTLRIEKLVYRSDLGMNSPFNPKNKKRWLHRHPAFFGTMLECMEDCCEHCPEPETEEERTLQAGEDASDKYIRGRIAFIQENPGRQMISGSFNPIDDDEWAEQAYLGPTERFFAAIAARDRVAVAALLNDGADPNRRDHVGRAPLHVAILAGAADVAGDLVDAGARMTARLVDGRSTLHLAAQAGLPTLLRKMFARSAQNAARAEAAAVKDGGSDDSDGMDIDEGAPPASDGETERASSQDDWSSDSSGEAAATGESEPDASEEKPAVDSADASGEVPEDAEDEADVLDPNAPDWDLAFTPVDHAVAVGSVDALGVLLAHGASPSKVTKVHGWDAQPVSALALAGVRHDDVLAVRLLMEGVSVSTAHEETSLSGLHRLVRMGGNASLVAALLLNDEQARAISDRPAFSSKVAVATYPLVSAIDAQDWATAAVLLAYGARWVYTEEEVSKDKHAHDERRQGKNFAPYPPEPGYPGNVHMPLDVALARQDPIAFLLLGLGAEVDMQPHGLRQSWSTPNNINVLDYARLAVKHIEEAITTLDGPQDTKDGDPAAASLDMATWFEYRTTLAAQVKKARELVHMAYAKKGRKLFGAARVKEAREFRGAAPNAKQTVSERVELQAQLSYWMDAVAALEARKTKTWNELDLQNPASTYIPTGINRSDREKLKTAGYMYYQHGSYENQAVPIHLMPLYNELYQACWTGDDAKINELCTPDEARTDKMVLKVAVEAVEDISSSSASGSTPLHVAILRRHWNTAKLLLAICSAQYKPEEEKLGRFENAIDCLDDEDEDMESDGEDESSQGTVVPLEDQFTDLITAPMPVQSSMSPMDFLAMYTLTWIDADGGVTNADSITKAISDADVEAFTQIAGLHAGISKSAVPLSIEPYEVLDSDSPDFLDEVIRRYGVGAPSVVEAKEEEDKSQTQADLQAEEKPKPKPGKRVYWGLNVHGVKRKDLANWNDPDAQPKAQRVHEMPLLWQAVCMNAARVVDYLNTKRPLEAYAYYAAHEKDARAMKLRAQGDLAAAYPDWIGWKPDALGQSVLLAAVSPYANHKNNTKASTLGLLRKLFEIQPTLMQDQLNVPIKSLDCATPLLVAVGHNLDVPTIKFLIEKGASFEVSGDDGWNILHLAVKSNNVDAVEWILKTLPSETVANFLIQATFGSQETPLHIAVDAGKVDIVKALTASDIQPRALVTRNLQGAIPLHLAVHQSFSEITCTLLDAALRTGMDVDIENGMGDTPLEVARQKFWLQKTRDVHAMGSVQEPRLLTPEFSVAMPEPQKINIPSLVARLTELKTTLADLSSHNELVQTETNRALEDFVVRVAKHIDSVRALTPDVAMEEDAPRKDKPIRAQEITPQEDTLSFVQHTYAEQTFERRLVRLDEIQEAVQAELDDRQREAERAEEDEAKRKDREGGFPEGASEEQDGEEGEFTGFRAFDLHQETGRGNKRYGNRVVRGAFAPRKILGRGR